MPPIRFSFATASIVLLMDNLAPGNKTFDNCCNVLYASCVSETFLYLLVSVIFYFLHFLWAEYRITQRRSNEIFIDNAGVFSDTLILYE